MAKHGLSHWLIPHETNNQRAKLLHPSGIVVVCLLIVFTQVVISYLSSIYPQILGYASQIAPEEIIRLTNQERQDRGLSALSLDPTLSAAASQKAADMFTKNYWAHVSPTGTQPWAFILDAGYAYRYAGENLARDFSDPKSVVSAWLNSPSHKENLLSNRYQDIGVAVVDGQIDGKETTLVVQMFGTKLAAAPQVSNSSLISVQAQEESVPEVSPEPAPVTIETAVDLYPTTVPAASPFTVSRTLILAVLGSLIVVLLVDLIVVYRRQLVRWTSKSFAHLMFVIVITVAVSVAIGGKIL